MQRVILSLVVFLCGCSNVVAPGERGLAESSADVDVADRECLVVLRRAGGGVATIDVDQKLLADPGATPGLLASADGGGWESLAAQPSAEPAPLGFARFTARLGATQSADFIAFARTTTEVRLFDHNRLAGDFDTFHVDASNGFAVGEAPDVCKGLKPVATLSFLGGYRQEQHGAIVAGDSLSIEYDLGRLTTCRDTHNGYRFWSLDAYAQFQPSGQIASGSVVASNGPAWFAVPFVTDVPAGATAVALWFRNASPPSCEGWDSNYGANYVFAVDAARSSAK